MNLASLYEICYDERKVFAMRLKYAIFSIKIPELRKNVHENSGKTPEAVGFRRG